MNDLGHRVHHRSRPEYLGFNRNNLSILNALGIGRRFVTFLLPDAKDAQDVTVLGGRNANTIRPTSYRCVVVKPGEPVIEGVSVRALATLLKLIKSFHDRIERLLDRLQLRQDQLANGTSVVEAIGKYVSNAGSHLITEFVDILEAVIVLPVHEILINVITHELDRLRRWLWIGDTTGHRSIAVSESREVDWCTSSFSCHWLPPWIR